VSSSYYENVAATERKRLEGYLNRRAAEDLKVARAEEAASKADQASGRASTASLAESKRREGQRKRQDANRAREASARATKSAADSQSKIHGYERKAGEARQSENRRAQSEAERKRRQAEQDAERQRHQDESAQRSRDEAARRQVTELATTTAQLEAQLDAARLAAPKRITVLLMAGAIEGGHQPLHLDREIREIEHKLRVSEYREQIQFRTTQATQVRDVIDALNQHDPDVVHFSGHSTERSMLFEGSDGKPHELGSQDFALLLQAARRPVRLVVFNSCVSDDQAVMATDFVDGAIGMRESIDDETAKLFAGQLYGSLASGNSLANAFRQAHAHASVMAQDDVGKPQLYTAPDVDPNQIVLVAP
jgi:hypothetical protein